MDAERPEQPDAAGPSPMRKNELMRPGTYSSIPLAVLARPDLTPAAKLVYTAMANHLRNGDTWIWPSIDTLMAMTNLGRWAVRKSLSQLETVGLAAVDRTPGKVNHYGMLAPDRAGKRPGRKPTGSESAPVARSESDPHPVGIRPAPGRKPTHTGSESDPETPNETREETPNETRAGNSSAAPCGKNLEIRSPGGHGRRETQPAERPDEKPGNQTIVGPATFAEVILKALQVGRGDTRQLQSDRATLKKAARKITAGHAGAVNAILTDALNAASNIGGDPDYKNKAAAWIDWFKRRLKANGHTWKEVEPR